MRRTILLPVAVPLLLLATPPEAGAQETIKRLGAFRTPSSNVHCEQWEVSGRPNRAELRCDVLQSDVPRPRPPKDCELDYGYAYMLTERKKGWLLCAGDTVVDPKHDVLEYGKTWHGVGIDCTVTPQMLRCTNRDGRGFELSRRRQRLV